VVLAALGAPATSRPLPWASGPTVPRPLSEPPPQFDVHDRKLAPGRLPALSLPPLPCVMAQSRAAPQPASEQSPWGECNHARMSRLLGAPKIASHAGDPIAAIEFGEDEQPADKQARAEKETPAQVAAHAPASDLAPGAPPAFIMPFANGRVTSLFNQGRRHPAIDLGGAPGSAVLATTTGQAVVFAGWKGGYGKAVIARDPLGRLHLYGHLESITAQVGQLLDQGTKLGQLGSTGRSTGPHVHYEVRDGRGGHIDPVGLLFPGRRVFKGLAWADVRLAHRPVRLASVQPPAQPRPR
jgi:murein DD-endopeptidase MepM/ murein hydrolase activator NlpD